MSYKKLLATGLIIAFAVVAYYLFMGLDTNQKIVDTIRPVSVEENYIRTYPYLVLDHLWLAYSDKIQTDGRTIDRSRNYLTTSEGQSYSLLRAVWMDDKVTFDRVLKWTNNNLRKRPDDDLFSWKWGQDENGNWGVLENEGGLNTASDADQDIALALIFASKRWNQDDYLEQALELLDDIWEVEVLELNGKYYMTAGNWAKEEENPTINPSYLSPAYYEIFAQVDPFHPWGSVKDTSYEVLSESTEGNLEYNSSANLPPDWINIDRATGEIIPVVHDDKTTHFSDDAIRVIWRVALDWEWNEDPRAREYLEKLEFLSDEWETRKKISVEYAHNGETIRGEESHSLYGAVLPYFIIIKPDQAEEILSSKIISLYDPDIEDFKESVDVGYYGQNWVWFGLAFYYDKLIDLSMIE